MWVGGSTVTCEHCGASLTDGEEAPEAKAASPGWWRSWWAALAVGGVVVVGGAGLAVGLLSSSSGEAPDVAAPATDPSDPTDPEREDAFGEVLEAGMTHCSVDDCELWRFELPGEGSHDVQDGMLFHTTRDAALFAPPEAAAEEDEPEDQPEVSERTITVVDLSVGELRWQRDVEMPRTRYGDVSPRLVGDLLLVPVPDGVVAYDIEDGSPVWTSDVVGLPDHVRPYEGDAVVAVLPPPEVDGEARATGPGGRLPRTLARFDGETGDVLWRRDSVSFASWGDDHVFIEDLDDPAVVAIDMRDGTDSWRHALPEDFFERGGSLRFDVADDRVVLGESRRATVLDLDTGDVVIELDEALPLRPRPWLLGSLLVFDLEIVTAADWEVTTPLPVQVVDLDDQGREAFRSDHVVDSAPVYEAGAADGVDDDRPTGVAFLSHVDGAYHLAFVDTDGVVRWEERWREPTCCWTIMHDRAEGTLAVLPHDLEEHPVRVLDVEDGSPELTLDVSLEDTRGEIALWGGSLLMLYGSAGDVHRTAVVGPEGWFAVATDVERARLPLLSPVPIVRDGLEMIAIDRDGLLGSR
jgi:hypothetical protein